MQPTIKAINAKHHYNAIAHLLGMEPINDQDWSQEFSSYEGEFSQATGRQLWINEHSIDIYDTEKGEIIEKVFAPFDDRAIAEQIDNVHHH